MFNADWGIKSPLSKFIEIINTRNNAIKKYCGFGSFDEINLPYGNNTFLLKSDLDLGVNRPLSNSYGNVLTSYVCEFGGTARYSGKTVSQWENENTNFDVTNSSPVLYISAAKVKDLYGSFSNYSEMKRAIYSSPEIYNGYQSMVSGIEFQFKGTTPSDGLMFSNVKPLSEIEDKYVITDIRLYATTTGELPRTVQNFYPVVLWNCNQTFATTSLVGRYEQLLPVGVETLFTTNFRKSIDSVRHWQKFRSSWGSGASLNFDDPANTKGFTLMIGFDIASDIFTTGFNAMYGKKISLPNYYNTIAFIAHNYNNGDNAGAGVLPTTTPTTGYILNAGESVLRGIFAADGLGNGEIAFNSLDDIRELFDDLGFTITFDVGAAQYYPSDDINPDKIPSGYNTNNSPSISSFPDNNTDDFSVGIGINPATTAINSDIFNQSSISNLLDWFTTPDFYDNFSRLFNDPLSAIISLRYYPFDIPKHDPEHVVATQSTKIVNVSNPNIGGYRFISGYNTVINGGNLRYTAYYGNFADWACCRYDLYVPYLGIINISPSAIVNKQIRIFYNVDFITGNAQIFIKTYDDKYNKSGDNGQLVFTTMSKLSVDVPITYTNWNEQNLYVATSAIRAISSIGSGAANGAINGAASGNIGAAIAGGVTGGLGSLANNALDYVNNFPRTEYGAKGDIGLGVLSPQDAYLLITRKILAIPANGYGDISGNPSAYYGLIKSTSGYIRATAAKCDNIPATNDEITEIMNLLSTGIYV